MLAERYRWPGSWVDEEDPDYIESLMVYLNALGDHKAEEKDKADKQQNRSDRHAAIQRKHMR